MNRTRSRKWICTCVCSNSIYTNDQHEPTSRDMSTLPIVLNLITTLRHISEQTGISIRKIEIRPPKLASSHKLSTSRFTQNRHIVFVNEALIP